MLCCRFIRKVRAVWARWVRSLIRRLGALRRHRGPWPRRATKAPEISPGHDSSAPVTTPEGPKAHWRRKPAWVRAEVLRLAVHLHSCRRVAYTFNRIHGHRHTVGHTWVNETCRGEAEAIADRRRAMRRRRPTSLPRNAVWAVDLTEVTLADGTTRQRVLGLLDHGSRRLVALKAVPRKCALVLVGHLCLAMAKHGAPKAIRSDNEGMFVSWRWRVALGLLGIRHQRSQPGCPWQNGRIERLFGTLKPLLAGVAAALTCQHAVQHALDEFSCFYNQVRPHQGLDGLTPQEAWHGLTWDDVRREAAKAPGRWVNAMGGQWVGFYRRL